MAEERRVNAGARALLLVASLVVVVYGLKLAGPLLVPVALALFLAILSYPLMMALRRRGVPGWMAILVCMLANIAALSLVVLLASQSIRQFQAELPKYSQRLDLMVHAGLRWLAERRVPVDAQAPLEFLDFGALLGFAHGTVGRVAVVVTDGFLVLVIMIFMLAEASVLPGKLRQITGRKEFDPARSAKIVREVQQYLGIKTGISVATGTLAGAWLAVLGVDLPVLWGLVTFAANYIPTIGWVIALIPPLVLGMFGGVGQAMLVAAGFVAIHIVLTNFIEPTLLGRRLGISTLVVVLSLLFWGWVWGPLGMLLSVPLTMVVKIAFENTDDLRWIAVLLAQGEAEPPGKSG